MSVDKTQAEIQSTLRRFKASSFMFGEDEDRGIVAFVINDRKIKMVLPLPTQLADKHWWASGKPFSGRKRTEAQARAALDQERKARWRGLLLCIKAKLESVDAGIESFDQAFLAYIALPTGQTVGEQVIEMINAAALDGTLPTRILAIEGRS
ncbi:hypothetical protein [Jatrophihabitans sp.]|uniref:hypothetical protein n=1 Tax=Jatrophihabitans sp. TaxID=1932789 RepID=UPI0030C6E033